MKQSREEVLTRMLRRLETKSPVANTDPGSIARTFTEIISEEFYEFYNQLELNSTMAFVSTAEGIFLDMLGKLLNCTRLPKETDSNYRYRITNQVYVIAGANQTAVRLKALTVPGVSNVIMQPFTRGSGSFTMYVVTEEPETPLGTLIQVEDIVNQVIAYGIRADIKRPVLIPLDLKVRLVFKEGVRDEIKTGLRQSAKEVIKAYMDNVPLGGTLYINEIIRAILNLDRNIMDVDIYELRVNNSLEYIRNISIRQGERFVLSSLDVV